MALVLIILYLIGLVMFGIALIMKPSWVTRKPKSGVANKAVRMVGVLMLFMAALYASKWFNK